MRWQYTDNGIYSNIGGKVVILNIKTNAYYELNDVGTYIWEMLAEQPNTEEITDAIIQGYEVCQDQCRNDVEEILTQLTDLSLIHAI